MAKNPNQKSRSQVSDDMTALIARHRVPIDHWYVGTAVAARDQMFDVHKFKESDVGLIRHMTSEVEASSLAKQLMGRGTKGDASIKLGANSIYLFKLAAHTKPALKT